MKNIFIVIFLSILLSSCQKVIDLELNSTSSQIVIEGSISNQSGPYSIKLSKSIDFDKSSNDYPRLSNALVKLSDDYGNSEILLEAEAGTYTTSTMQGIPGHTYTLMVTIDSKIYTATCYMPYPVNIDTILATKSMLGNNNQYTLKFNDPENISNYYRIILIENNKSTNSILITNDKLNDGKLISYTSMAESQMKGNNNIQPDSITMCLLSIDENVYEYFRTAAGTRGTQSATPANPTSNITNGALGYFNAYSYTIMTIKNP